MTQHDNAVTACPDLSAEARRILLDESLSHAQVRVLLLQLADPELSVTDLAKQANVSRNTARRALTARALSARPAQPLRDPAHSVRGDASRTCARVTSLSFGEIERSTPTGSNELGDTSPRPSDLEDPPPDLVLEEPRASGKPKPRTIAHDTGLSTAELAALARRVLAERRAAELTTPSGFRAENNRSLRAMLAGFLRDKDPTTGARVVDPDRLVAACASTASLSSKAIAWQLNAGRTIEAAPRKPNAGGWQSHAQSLVPADYGEG